MGTYVNGANGAFRGKVGSVVGSSWNGINYMKGLPNVKKNATPTEAQRNQQNKVSIAAGFLKNLKQVIALGFNDNETGLSRYSSAVSYVLKNALDTTTTPYSILYNKVLVTKGDLPNGTGPTATADAAGKITFTWVDNTGLGTATATDTAILVAYSSEMNLAIFSKNSAARSAATASLNAASFKGQTVETYIAFMKADGSDVSQSLYTGQVTVTA